MRIFAQISAQAGLIAALLLYLEAQDAEKDILLYINCPGGSITGRPLCICRQKRQSAMA